MGEVYWGELGESIEANGDSLISWMGSGAGDDEANEVSIQMAAWEFQTLQNIAKQHGWHQFISIFASAARI